MAYALGVKEARRVWTIASGGLLVDVADSIGHLLSPQERLLLNGRNRYDHGLYQLPVLTCFLGRSSFLGARRTILWPEAF